MRNRHSWRGLYLLGALAAGLLFADALAPMSLHWHDIVTVGIIFLVLDLTFLWTEKHADLFETDGVDAQAADDQLQRRWFIAEGEQYALPRPAPQKRLADGNTQNTEEQKCAILDRELLHKV